MTKSNNKIEPPAKANEARMRFSELALVEAIERNDMDAVWSMGSTTGNQAEFYEALKLQTFNISHKMRKGKAVAEHNTSLFMLPVVMSGHMTGRFKDCYPPDLIKASTAQVIATAIAKWTNYKTEVRVSAGLWRYDGITCRDPAYFRGYLNKLVWNAEVEALTGVSLDPGLPYRGAPELYFFKGAFTSLSEWPSIPNCKERATHDLVEKVKSAMWFAFGDEKSFQPGLESSIHVGPPMFGDMAIEEGIRMMITSVDQDFGIKAWHVRSGPEDLVWLQLKVEDNEKQLWGELPVRLHQVGVDGVERLIAYAAKCCDAHMENNLDLPAAHMLN